MTFGSLITPANKLTRRPKYLQMSKGTRDRKGTISLTGSTVKYRNQKFLHMGKQEAEGKTSKEI